MTVNFKNIGTFNKHMMAVMVKSSKVAESDDVR